MARVSLLLLIPLSLSPSLSYTKKVVGNGVHAQRQNPELKVRGADPALMEVKDRLEQFSQVTPLSPDSSVGLEPSPPHRLNTHSTLNFLYSIHCRCVPR